MTADSRTTPPSHQAPQWQERLFDTIKASEIKMIGYVPDAGHMTVINLAKTDPDIEDVVLTTEEEGVGLCAGAWLGGKRALLLMQSSGVGNCINALSLQRIARFPLVMIVTMRGEYAEFNPWQIPMGTITEQVLGLCEVHTYRANTGEDAAELTLAAIDIAFSSNVAAAVLLSQRLIGRKQWGK